MCKSKKKSIMDKQDENRKIYGVKKIEYRNEGPQSGPLLIAPWFNQSQVFGLL